MNNKSYIKRVYLFVIVLLIITALTNFIVDPAQVYPKLFSNNKSILKDFSKELSLSKYGIINEYNNLNERDRKKAIAMFSEGADCAIIGSSHIMQISTYKEDKVLTKYCNSLINLGVSGGTLEDYFAFSNMLLENKNHVDTIVFGIDPWSLKFGSDGRWGRIKSDFDAMNSKLNLAKQYPNHSYALALILNLMNLEYLKESFDKLKTKKESFTEKEKETFKHAKKHNPDKGIEGVSVTLPDGGWEYTAEHIGEVGLWNSDGIHDYKISKNNGEWFEESAISDLIGLVEFLKPKFNIVFVMTPYHPKIWATEQPTIEAMQTVESRVNMLGKQLNITVIGSYNPAKIGCYEDEFFDGMHSTMKCLKKLEKKIVIN